MVGSVAQIVFEIIYFILYTTINTSIYILGLFLKLLSQLSYMIFVYGPLGIVLSFLILFPIVYFIVKFFSGGIKIVLIGFSIFAFFLLFLLLFL